MRDLYLSFLILMALTLVAGAEAYRLGHQDVITVSVLRHPEFSGEFLIPPDGIIAVPGVGALTVADLTTDEVSAAVREHLQAVLRAPEVSVAVKSSRARYVYVLGEVGKPGMYDWQEGWRVTEALAAAGGLATPANECTIRVLRGGTGDKQDIAAKAAMRHEQGMNVAVRPGDVVTVETVERWPVYVSGAVKQPGMYRITSGEGPLEALAMAGGALESASPQRAQILRANGARETVNLAAAMHEDTGLALPVLHGGDVLIVPESTARIAVLGFVNNPGYYPLREDRPLRLTDALGMALGADNKRAGITTVAVLRIVKGKQERLLFDVRKFLTDGDAAQNPLLHAGDIVYVPETNKPDWTTIFQGLTSVSTMLLLL